MAQDYSPGANFPWNRNAELQYQLQMRIQNFNYYRPEKGSSSSSSNAMKVTNPNHATDSTFNYTLEQLKLPDSLSVLKPLGLKLKNSPELASWMEKQLNRPQIGTTKLMAPKPQPAPDKQKPENTPANMIKIGSWERVAKNASDVMTKCYFAKKKLVWEILEGGLKNKIEFLWSNIIAINACIRENEPGVLRIELDECPSFFQEKDPQPRRHTIWMPASDFTGGQASKCRRHEIVFSPGNLNKPYKKLLLADQRLSQLSTKPFPSVEDPYFPSLYDYCPDFNQTHNSVTNPVQYPNPQQQFSQLSSPSPISDEQMTTNAAMWGEMLPEPSPNVGLVSYDTSAPAAAMGNQYLAPQRRYHGSSSGAALSDGHINSNNLLDTEMSCSQFSGSVSDPDESPSVDKSYLMRQRLEILGNLEIGHDAGMAIRPNEMFYNHQKQQQQQVFVPDPAAAGLITSGGEMYVQQQQQQQQAFVPDPTAAGLMTSGGEMYEQPQQQEVLVPDSPAAGLIKSGGKLYVHQHQQEQEQQQQQQQVFVPDPTATGLMTSGGEMYEQQHQQQGVFVPDPPAAGLITSGGEMYEQQQQKEVSVPDPPAAGLITSGGKMYEQQQQQVLVPDPPAAAGLMTGGEEIFEQEQVFVPDLSAADLITSGWEMYEQQQQQQSGFFGYHYPFGEIADPELVHFD